MPWFKVDDALYSHPKWLSASSGARALWVTAGSWCASQLTDGFVPRHVLSILCGKPRDAAELVKVGLWSTEGDGWRFHSWLEFQPSAEQVEAERAAARERMAKVRANRHRSSGEHQANVRENFGRSSGDVRSPRPDPTRPDPSGDPPVAAAPSGTDPRRRQQRIDEACRALAQERAERRGDVGPGWVTATARGIATDHHQELHAHLVAHPDATAAQLIDLIERATPLPATVSRLVHPPPVATVLADRPQPMPKAEQAAGIQAARARLHPEGP